VSLTAAEVAEIMRLVEQSGFDELALEIDGTKIRLRRGAPAETFAGQEVPRPIAVATPGSAAAPTAADPNVQEVRAPLLGTFYRAPKPGAAPFVDVGAEVNAETIVGIVEVMKLMNTVRAGVSGTVMEFLVTDGALVEYGATLLLVRKAG
jgi:acetyl-CoA carboxylase biotin carboxyl carrier protein